LKNWNFQTQTGRGKGITIVPHPAGHTIGGAIWLISKETDEIVYAVHYNNIKDRFHFFFFFFFWKISQLVKKDILSLGSTNNHYLRHLNETTFPKLSRPSLLITDSYNANVILDRRKQRDGEFFGFLLAVFAPWYIYAFTEPFLDSTEYVYETLTKEGNVLVPIDAASRVLEIALVLEQFWTSNIKNIKRLGYRLILLTHRIYNPINFGQKMTEWMSDEISKNLSVQEVPYTFRLEGFHLLLLPASIWLIFFRSLQFCHDISELDSIKEPMLVLATSDTLETGPGAFFFLYVHSTLFFFLSIKASSFFPFSIHLARELFAKWAPNPKNTVIFVKRGPPNTLARYLQEEFTPGSKLDLKVRCCTSNP